MEICNHIIASQDIIGISPLYPKVGDGSFYFLFFVHTKQLSVHIQSPVYETLFIHSRETDPLRTPHQVKQEQLSLLFKKEYLDAYSRIFFLTLSDGDKEATLPI